MVGKKFRGAIAECFWAAVLLLTYLTFANGEDVCETPECKETAETILKSMDTDVDPCNNFYKFVCGNYDKGDTAPITGWDRSVMSGMGDHLDELVIEYLGTRGDEKKNQPFHQAFELFGACVSMDADENQDLEDLHKVINDIGGWPLVEGTKWKEVAWENVTGLLTETGFDSGIFFDVRVVQIGGPVIQLSPLPIYEFSDFEWEQVMVIAKKFGADPNSLPPVQSPNHIHSFDNIPSNQISMVYLTVSQLIAKWPSIDWESYLSGVFAGVPDVTVDEDQGVVVPSQYVDELVLFLRQTPPAAIMNYVAAVAVNVARMYLPPGLTDDPDSPYMSVPLSQSWLQSYCRGLVKTHLPLLIEAIFEVNYVDDDLFNSVMSLSNDLKAEFAKLIEGAKWLDPADRDECLQKLHDMGFKLGYPEDIKDGYYTKDYEGLEIDDGSFVFSMLSLNKFMTAKSFIKSILNDQSGGDGRFPIDQVNALYNPNDNSMNIMPAILQDPFINQSLPKYITYSGIGFVLGHETTHGYDYASKIFGYYVNYPPQEESVDYFNTEFSCVAQQFAKYVYDTYGLEVDGYKYCQENIADDGGTKMAYHAYKKYVDENGPEPLLPGLNYTLMQTFWISLAHTQCGVYNEDLVPTLLSADTHGLHEFRVIAPLSNNPEFGELFNCPLGSNMNPEEKCIIW